MKHKSKRLLSILLSFVMVLGADAGDECDGVC